MDFKQLLDDRRVMPFLGKARFGVEKESHRVDLSGNLAKTDHPSSLSVQDHHPYIQRDFSETQMELITPVTESLEELLNFLSAIHDVTYRSISEDEMLWPLSMPPALPQNEEEIVIAKLNNLASVEYRQALAKSYGRRKQMISGIHFNFEFSEELLKALFSAQTEIADYDQFKTAVYLKVTRNYLHYRWLYTYLFGASPLSEQNFFEENTTNEPVRSLRNSKFGYTNREDVKVSFKSIHDYVSDLTTLVKNGQLVEEKEFYSPVRLRGGQRVADLQNHGIQYIELRNIDLNPFELNGISYEQAKFLHVFLVYLLWKEEGACSDEWVQEGDLNNNTVALEHPLEKTAFHKEARTIVEEMERFVQKFKLEVPESLFENVKNMIEEPTLTLAGRLVEQIGTGEQRQVATTFAKDNYDTAWKHPYQLAGFTDMELSTQILLFDAMQQGIKVDIIDRQEQFIKLQVNEHVEYVKNGNMTSKDTYISSLIMENKTVTKKILHAHGYRVPQGEEFQSEEQAMRAYQQFSTKPFVVKPKSTNYGLGISIFKEGAAYEDYEKAISLAFKEDSSVLLEEFIHGTEYRFFVVDGKVLAVLLRVPANVEGDGKQTIEELVAQKNHDPLRGRDHRTPLEIIQLGELEKLMLKGQGFEISSVPKSGEIVYLRENSNISTGGDSIDVTDQIPDDYKKIAAEAVTAIGARICGIDLLIENTEVPATDENAYGIIEANFNPSMYMHIYPYKGESRRVTQHILRLLFPEVG
ncbi:bifunctional glutamate--cysteine ligase GshA/glutathione synthetase GshB [Sporosarcina sp. ITBMC105]